MTIRLPENIRWNGKTISTAEALERFLKEDAKQNNPLPDQTITQTNSPNIKGYIWIPSIKLCVAKERSLGGLTWDATQEELKKQNLMMPTPYQFREFLKYLRDSKNPEHKKIFNDIVEVRDPWRAEWINARFEKRKNGLYMISKNILINGKYQDTEQKLDNFIAKDKTPGISLDNWLNSNVGHGSPDSKTSKGELYYWAPEDGRVAGFGADSDRAGFSGDWKPAYSGAALGVFVCAEGAAAKNTRR